MAPIPQPIPPSNIINIAIEEALSKRQTIVAIPATYGSLNSGPSPGEVVGIVLGSVGGFLLVLWLLYTCFGGGGFYVAGDNVSSVVIRESRKSRGSRSRRTRSERETVIRETRRAPPPVVPAAAPVERVERVIVEERREAPAPAPARSTVRSVVSANSGDDEVVVIEEHSPEPPPRRNSERRVREVREVRRESGYRPVDPMAYGGGDRPLREVRRSSRR